MFTQNFASLPSKSILCGELIKVPSSLFHRKFLYGGVELPPLESPNQEDLDQALYKMDAYFCNGAWRRMPRSDKVNIILAAAKSLERHAEIAAFYDSVETGRSFSSLINDSIPKAIQTIQWFCAAIQVTFQKSFDVETSLSLSFSKRLPYGLCLCILPWNDPLVLFAWKVIPALLSGNSVIVKPSERSSSSALFFASLLYEAGLPFETLSIVVGKDSSLLQSMVTNPLIPVISMTGSTRTALAIQHVASQSGHLKKLSFECGGKSPFLVTSHNSKASLLKACQVIVDNMFYNQGQICSAPSLLICEDSVSVYMFETIYDMCIRFLPGDPLDEENIVGTMCDPDSVLRIYTFLERVKSLDIRVLQVSVDDPKLRSCAIPPTILLMNKDIYTQNDFLHQELFGPVLTIVTADTYQEMLDLSNSSSYGLASALWSESLEEVQIAIYELQAGLMHVNSYGQDEIGIPFGGIKDSGDAKEKCLEAFDQFCYSKTVYIGS